MILCSYVKHRNHRWEKTSAICHPEIDFIHLTWLSPSACIFLQTQPLGSSWVTGIAKVPFVFSKVLCFLCRWTWFSSFTSDPFLFLHLCCDGVHPPSSFLKTNSTQKNPCLHVGGLHNVLGFLTQLTKNTSTSVRRSFPFPHPLFVPASLFCSFSWCPHPFTSILSILPALYTSVPAPCPWSLSVCTNLIS